MSTNLDLADHGQMIRSVATLLALEPIPTWSWQLYLTAICGFYLYVEKNSKNHKPKVKEINGSKVEGSWLCARFKINAQ